jgi:hypothetical protein
MASPLLPDVFVPQKHLNFVGVSVQQVVYAQYLSFVTKVQITLRQSVVFLLRKKEKNAGFNESINTKHHQQLLLAHTIYNGVDDVDSVLAGMAL